MNSVTSRHNYLRASVQVDEQTVPRPSLNVTLAQSSGGEVSCTVTERQHEEIRITEITSVFGSGFRVLVVDIPQDVIPSRVLCRSQSVAIGQQCTERLEQVAGSLLSEHVRVALPCDLRQVILAERGEATSERVTVTSACTTALLDRGRCHNRTQGLETG